MDAMLTFSRRKKIKRLYSKHDRPHWRYTRARRQTGRITFEIGIYKKNGAYTHPERKVLFVGDYIDRGPKIKETLEIVKAMVDSENAIALMGNHEYNALCFHFQETEGGHLRKHLIKNIIQHYETLKQFQNRQKDYEKYLE